VASFRIAPSAQGGEDVDLLIVDVGDPDGLRAELSDRALDRG
jgi:hypothetical protein